ncbi:MAG: transcriptional regulator [Actinobacteria bacterium]|nr:transcriptional regulator [Actinomycetota bacterium]MCL5886882.1 transcriptional regulator [Actinomycetota bacterium]
MRFYRIGNKVISRDKLFAVIDEILTDRENGSTQEEVASSHKVQRTFVSFLESLGEVRRGPKVALVGFPVSNADPVISLAESKGLDFVLVFSQKEREDVESASGYDVFNRLLETLAALRDFDLVVLMASDWRIDLVERILGAEVIGIPLGTSPLREDVEVDLVALETLLDDVLSARSGQGRSGRVSAVLREAADKAERWSASRRS